MWFKNYYEQFHPRLDKFSGEKIEFYNFDQYFSTDFKTKNNLKKWLKENEDAGKAWAIEWLKHRKEKKNLKYAPSQVELRSLTAPTMHYYNNIGNYNNICKEIGYKLRLTSNNSLKISS